MSPPRTREEAPVNGSRSLAQPVLSGDDREPMVPVLALTRARVVMYYIFYVAVRSVCQLVAGIRLLRLSFG